MTLINSETFHVIINTFGMTLFTITMLWTFWFASKMD